MQEVILESIKTQIGRFIDAVSVKYVKPHCLKPTTMFISTYFQLQFNKL
jgi:hypothetical protein